MAGCSRRRLECARFHRRFGFGAPAAVGRGLACRGDGKAVLQAHALQTLARLLIHRFEATGTRARRSVPNLKPARSGAMEGRMLAAKLGTTTHLSPLRKAQRLGLDAAGLERLALQRGCDYYHSGEPIPPASVSPGQFTNEELAIALLHPVLPYHPRTLRLGAAIREEPDRPAFAFSRGVGARSPRSGVKPPG